MNVNGERTTTKTIELVNRYCADSLLHIEFKSISNFPKNLVKPFTKVENIKFHRCYFYSSNDIIWLNKLFPKMRELYINLNGEEDYKTSLQFIVHEFSFLTKVTMDISSKEGLRGKERKNFFQMRIVDARYANIHLKQLHVDKRELFPLIDENYLQKINKSLQNLKSLQLTVDDGFNCKVMRLENLKDLTLFELSYAPFSIPFTSDKLEKLYLRLAKACSETEYDFIRRHPTITELKFGRLDYSVTATEYVNASRIAKALPSLERIVFDEFFKITVDEIILNWMTIASIKEVTFNHPKQLAIQNDDLKSLVTNGWSIQYEPFINTSYVHLK